MARHRWATGHSDRGEDRLNHILGGSSVPGVDRDSVGSSDEPPDPRNPDYQWDEEIRRLGGAEESALRVPRRRWVAARRAALVAVGCALAIAFWAFISIDRSEEEVIPVVASAEQSSETGGGPETHQGESAGPTPISGNREGGKGTADAPDGGEGSVVVHVAGAVQQPGVVEAPAGSRVFELLESVGGVLPEAELSAVNLAAVVQDGQQILIPRKGEVVPQPGADQAAASGSGSSGGSALVNLNTAGAGDLEELPRIGPVLAERIVQWRTEHGSFSRPEDIDAVPGIGPAMLEALLPLVTV